MPETSKKVLLAMRPGWSTDKGVSPVAGKSQRGRGESGRRYNPGPRIMFTPRPHIDIKIQGQRFRALLDGGSEISLVNRPTADILTAQGFGKREEKGEITLANGATSETLGRIRIPLRVGDRKIRHDFVILPDMEDELIIGIDGQYRLRLGIPPPPRYIKKWLPKCNAIGGLAVQTIDEKEQLQIFLKEELEKFKDIRGPTDKIKHHIRVKNNIPIKQRYRPRNPAMQEIINKEVDEMLRQGVIEPSHSPWSSPIVIVGKKDGKHRFCIDFRRVNDVTHKDAYPLPQITATLDKLREARYLSTLDLKNGYWQVPLAPGSRPITAFTIPGKGLFQFTVMPFGLHSAPATFQRLLDTVLGPDLEPHVFVYLDDIIIISRTFQEHLELLAETFRRLRNAKLQLNPDKCKFCVEKLKYLGHIIDREGIRTDPEKVSAVADWPEPRTVKQIRQFVGMASWYRRFIAGFSEIVAPLTKLTKKNARWAWGPEQTEAFNKIKKKLISAPVLACPDFTRRFILQTDASTSGLGAVLTQQYDDGEKVVAYASRTLNKAEQNYTATELECLAIVWGIRRMKSYLEGYAFTVITDHQALKWLQKIETPTGRLGRWVFELQQYDFNVQYRRGVLNRVADALSRHPAICAIRPRHCKWYDRIREDVQRDPTTRPGYRIQEGKLYRHILHTLDFKETSSEAQWKLCIPAPIRQKVLEKFHNEATAGHLGIAKTIARIAEKHYWPGMFRDIAKYVRNCGTCQSYKASQEKPAGKLHATEVKRPWQQVCIDLIGPMPRSKKGHTWLLVMQDRFSKWTELVPLRRATAEAVTQAVTNNIILRHGKPESILSDNGTQLRSRQLEQRLAECNIKHVNTPAYAPHCNPVERTNRSIKTMISQYTGRNQKTWDEKLNALQFAYNTAVHDATGFTPAFLNCGRELISPVEDDPPNNQAPAPENIRRQLEDANELVKIHLARAFEKQKRFYDLRRRAWKPRIGEWVWRRSHQLSKKSENFNAKLAPKYEGPYEVRRIISPVIVDLRSTRGKWLQHIHIQDLKTAKNDKENVNNNNDDSESDSE